MRFSRQARFGTALAAAAMLLIVPACRSSDARAEKAYGDYQAAAAANNLPAARDALLQLVATKDDVVDYWVELGKVQLAMGAQAEASEAFSRAHELDRSNPELLRSVTQVALFRGDFPLARSYARKLEVLAPDDRMVVLTNAYSALAERRFDDVLKISNDHLATSHFDSAAIVLKARALLGKGLEDEAVELLEAQTRTQPDETGSFRLLLRIYERRSDWKNVISVARRLAETTRREPELALLLIEAQLRSRQFGEARQSSFQLLQQHGDPAMYSSVLARWARWPTPNHAEDARILARNARSLDQRLAIAAYFNRVGKPKDALQLAARHGGPSVNAANAEAIAIVADALYRLGDTPAASRRFDAVLAFDPGNATALRGRTELRLSALNSQGAIMDALKLVSVSPTSGEDRLLLARAYRAAGDTRQEQRVLWQAFRDISADEQIYAALAAPRRRNPDALHALEEEFARQRDAKINQGYI